MDYIPNQKAKIKHIYVYWYLCIIHYLPEIHFRLEHTHRLKLKDRKRYTMQTITKKELG